MGHHADAQPATLQTTGDVGSGGAGVGGSASTGNVNGDGNTGSIGGDGTGGAGVDNGRHLLGHKKKHNHYKHYDDVQQVPAAVWRIAAQVNRPDSTCAAHLDCSQFAVAVGAV